VEIFFEENGVGLRPSAEVMTLSNRLHFSSAFVLYPQADSQSQPGKRRNRVRERSAHDLWSPLRYR